MVTPLLILSLLTGRTDPPIHVWLKGGETLARGDHARVQVRAATDGYLVVLRADGDGRVRVLFPLDPGDDAFVRGGKTLELKGRGGRESFAVDGDDGGGVVVAAFSADAFTFDQFVRGDHWDYRVLGGDAMRDDPEAGLLDIVQRLAGDNHFDYETTKYTVESYGYGSHAYMGHSFYRPLFYDPFFYDPFYRPWWGWGYPRTGFSIGLTFGTYDPFFYDPFWYGGGPYGAPFCWNDPFCFGGGFRFTLARPFTMRRFLLPDGPPFVLRNDRGLPPSIAPRPRSTPPATASGPRPGIAPRERDASRRGAPPTMRAAPPRTRRSAPPARAPSAGRTKTRRH